MTILLTVVQFFLSPVGRFVGFGLVVLAAYGYGYYKGDAHGDKQCADAALRNRILRQKVEINIARDQAGSEKKVAEELKDQQSKLEGVIRDLREKLKSKPSDVFSDGCVIPGVVSEPKHKR